MSCINNSSQKISTCIIRHKVIVIVFFIVYFIAGLCVFRDFGISWDEHIQRLTGVISFKYIIDRNPILLDYPDRYYGPFFEMLLVGVESLFRFSESRSVYLMRHLMTFLLFYLSAIFFYKLNKRIFQDWKWALLSTFMLILSPRIFAHSFFNSKDIAFLSLFLISIYTLFCFLEKRNVKMAVIHGVTTALAVDVRILGVIGIVMTCMGLIYTSKNLKKTALLIFVYCSIAVAVIILFWPVLWSNPVHHFIEAFKEMSRYPSDGKVLYFGQFIKSTALPWHYVPAWILISTPLIYSFFFIIGSIQQMGAVFRKQERDARTKTVIILCWIYIPLVVVIILKSVMYDAWRQMFFIYPAFVILSVSGIRFVFTKGRAWLNGRNQRIFMIGFKSMIAGYLLSILITIIQFHPFQNVYLNNLVGTNLGAIKYKFDLDYWGLSYRNALEYILAVDSDEKIPISVANSPGKTNALILPRADQLRLNYVPDPNEAKYYLSNDRGRVKDYPFQEMLYSIHVDGARIMGVYKLK